MEFDAYRRHIKEKEINKYIENNKIKIQEEQRQKNLVNILQDIYIILMMIFYQDMKMINI